MPGLISSKEIKQKLNKLWKSSRCHKAWLGGETLFPYRLNVTQPTDKILLHQFDQVRSWIADLSTMFANNKDINLIRQERLYGTMGRQTIPVAIEFENIEKLARFLGKWQEWQSFCLTSQKISAEFPGLSGWLKQNPASITNYQDSWPQLLAVCRYFVNNPKPGYYIRELDIVGVDTKFVERHKKLLKTLLDQLLPPQAINSNYDKLSDHGFEKRFGLKYALPRVRFRVLDNNMCGDLSGLADLELPVDQFAVLDLPCDRVFITENKTNGLSFPMLKNAIVVFGLGYGLKTLGQVPWLQQCRLYYWGDIDTDGFAILSQARSYFPKINSFLMDEQTLLDCKKQWGEDTKKKAHSAKNLPGLTEAEQMLYHKLKNNHWQANLRLEQEKIPFSTWQDKLKYLI